MKIKIDTDLQEIVLNRFGIEHQSLVAVEELSELQKAITKLYRNPEPRTKPLAYRGYRENLVEEIADVAIMITQLLIFYQISEEELQEDVTYKEVRMKYRLTEEK